MVIGLLAHALAAPPVVVTFDNGGFNLPLYTSRWNGHFAQPSVARQLAADIARLAGTPRVFTYLPPGSTPGRSSEPHEVHPARPECPVPSQPLAADDPCACPPGDRCWGGLDLNLDPAASTSLFQAATAVRARVQGPRVEVHITDLFEEDPNHAEDPADADRCVTADSTRKAMEALFGGVTLDHVAVGLLTARVDPPRTPVGGLTAFAPGEGGCWSARRLRTFGPGAPAEVAMAVVVLGIETAADDAFVRDFVEGLERQISGPLALDLAMVREPALTLDLPPLHLRPGEVLPARPLPARSTPCAALTAQPAFTAGVAPLPVHLAPTPDCGTLGTVALDPGALRRAWRASAGLDPRVGGVGLAGEIQLVGDLGSVRAAVEALPADPPVADRPLVFWGALVDALRLDSPRGVARPRQITVRAPAIWVGGLDDRPWGLAGGLGALGALGALGLAHRGLGRFAAERAFRRHLARAAGRPVAAVLAEAQEDARAGWGLRLGCAGVLALGAFFALALAVLALGEALHG